MDCSPPGSSFHGILQAKVLEWVATSFSRLTVGIQNFITWTRSPMSTGYYVLWILSLTLVLLLSILEVSAPVQALFISSILIKLTHDLPASLCMLLYLFPSSEKLFKGAVYTHCICFLWNFFNFLKNLSIIMQAIRVLNLPFSEVTNIFSLIIHTNFFLSL